MKRCNKCNLNVNSIRKTCPLCGQLLNDNKENSIDYYLYPRYTHEEKKANIVLKIVLFFSIVAIFIAVVINILTYKNSRSLWSIYVILGIWYGWILLRFTIMSRRNIAGRLLLQMLATSAVVIGIEKVSHGSGWALEYVIPFICIATTQAIVIILVSKKMRYNDYLLYLFVAILISFVPIILYWSGIVQVLWPSISAAGVALITIMGMLIFADRATKDEFKKRFHL